MTENLMKFMELVSKDENVKKELEAATSGISKDDKKALADEVVKFAAKHGFTLTAEDFEESKAEEMSEDEMKAVAGGKCNNDLFLLFCGSTNLARAMCGYAG